MGDLVVDASCLVDLLLGNEFADAARHRITGHVLHAPAHVDAEVLSALGRLHRGAQLASQEVQTRLRDLASAPIQRHPVEGLLLGAWARRARLRLADALYVELAQQHRWPLVTTDPRLRDAPAVEVLSAGSPGPL